MINIVKAVLESAETNDFSLKSIDPREKSYNEETDNMLYREAYEKACIGIKTCYDSHEKLYREVISNIRYECQRTNINQDSEKNVELHVISVNPQIDFNVMKLLDDFFTSTDMSKFNSSDEFLTTLEANVISQMGSTPINKEGYIGPVVSLPIKGILVSENLNMVERNIMNAADELYSVYEFIGKKIAEEKNPMYLEAYARMFEYCAKLISYEIGAYGVAALELLQIGGNLMTINESAVLTETTNEENAKKYIDEIDKLIDEIRAFYDKFEYKEIIIPRKKKEPKMYEYVLGALQRKYTLRIPIYKVEGASDDVKDIVEHKFIDKLESITKKYPNFVIMSPNWENDSDIFIYITLREPFGEKEDRKDRENQVQNEAADDPHYAINRKIKHLKKKIEMNEIVQDRYIEKNGYENKSLAKEHDKMCDEMEELCRERREIKISEQNESVTLNEGVGTKITAAIIATPILLSVLIGTIEDIKDIKKIKEDGKNLKEIKDYNCSNIRNFVKLLRKAKFAKYNPDVISYIRELSECISLYHDKIAKLDNDLRNLDSWDDFYNKKDYFTKLYKELNTSYKNDVDKICNKYKNSKKEWVENLDVIPVVSKYIEYIWDGNTFIRPIDEAYIDWLPNKLRKNIDDDNLDINATKMINVAENFKFYHFKEYRNPFTMIKVQLSGKTLNESVALNEASLSKAEKDNLEYYEFGLPEKRTYPLNDEVRIKQAIKFFGYCIASDKKTLADNIVRRIIELDLVGVVTISPSHPNKKFFPEWMLNTCKPTLERKGNKYTIYVDGERVDYGTLEDHSSSDEGARVVVVNESGMLF